ncbi:MAG: hypothetical protein KKD39_07660 [Candidatus Altiarchaeota archaeon]|nr:hypothetical protein [Candidatus Altiarchaeota archaeon]
MITAKSIDLQSHDLAGTDFTSLPSLQKVNVGDLGSRLAVVSGRIHQILKEGEQRVSKLDVLHRRGSEPMALMALGWLAQEGHVTKTLFHEFVQPTSEYPTGEDMQLIKSYDPHGFVSDWAIIDSDFEARKTQAMRKAFGYGMHRRAETFGREPEGVDREIGKTAGEVLGDISRYALKITLSDLIDRVYEKTELGVPSEKEMIFMVAAGIGYLAAVDDVILVDDRNRRSLYLCLREGRSDVSQETTLLGERAEKTLGIISRKKGVDISELMGVDGGKVENAVVLGYMLRRSMVRLEAKGNSTVVHPN